MVYNADIQAQELVYGSHPRRVAPRQVVVDGHKMRTETGNSVQIEGKGGDECFSFSGFHFRNPAQVEHEAADELDVEGAHSQGPAGRLPDEGEGFGEYFQERILEFPVMFIVRPDRRFR